jgi:hypothetical protein
MEENEAIGYDAKTLLMNRVIGVALVCAGIYGLYYAYKMYKNK